MEDSLNESFLIVPSHFGFHLTFYPSFYKLTDCNDRLQKNMVLFPNTMNLSSTELGKELIDITTGEIFRPSGLQLC